MKVYFSNFDFFNILNRCPNDEGVYLVDDLYHCYIDNKFNDYQKLIDNYKLFYDLIETICDNYNAALFDINDDMYFKFNDDINILNQAIKVYSSDGLKIDLLVKKENVKGNINNKLRKIVVNNDLYYYLDVKSFKTIEEYDEAFLQIIKDFDMVSEIYDKSASYEKERAIIESNNKLNVEDFGE